MNQDYNHNEVEIYDSGMPQSRYPFAEAPVFECECMDYQSVMNVSGGQSYVEQQNVVTNAITTSFQVIRELYRSNKSILSAAGGIIKSIFNFLWKKAYAQDQWKEFMQAAEILVNQKISDQVLSEALAQLQGLEEILRVQLDLQDDLATDPSNTILQEQVRNHALNVHDFFIYTMPQLRESGYEVQQLVAYAEAANLHLAFLRDVVMFGFQWGIPSATVETYYTYLKNNIQAYTDHCVNTYNTGLEQTKNLMGSINPQDYTKYPYLNPYANSYTEAYKKVLQWNVMNDFRRDMTTMALDLVVVWPTYDPRVYSNLEGVEIELSREVYSTAYGRVGSTHGGDWKGWEAIETAFVRPPHLVSFLTNLYVYERTYYPGYIGNRQDQFQGVVGTFRDMGTKTWEDGFRNYRAPAAELIQRVIPGDYINGYDMHLAANPCDYRWKTSSSGTVQTGYCMYTIDQPNIYDFYPNIQDHRLSYVNSMYGSTSSSDTWGLTTWGLGWLHTSLKQSNIIHATRSSHIPAVKGYHLEFGAVVVKGPGSTGGDLIKLPAYNTEWTQFRTRVRPERTGTPYRVRIRYAAQANASLFVGKHAGGWRETATLSLTATTSSNTPSYSEFRLIDAFNTTANESEFQMEFRCNSGGPVFIDRIEFIPIQGTLEEYEAKERLETAWKAVNALFTNGPESTLRLDATDYDVNQAACKVKAMSDDMYLKEKMCLLDRLKYAKRSSQTRNLLKYGDFDSPYWLGEDGWQANNNVMVMSDGSDCNERSLNMPGANVIEGNVVPTYVYQKVEESKLKPYTRYLVRGVVRNSKDLELFVSRYGKEVHANFPLNLMDTCNQTLAMKNKSEMMVPLTNGTDEKKQFFVFHIDVGEIYPQADLGIGVGFKISSTSGRAQLENLEVIEANPLTGEALARVKKREQKWKREMEQKCARTEPIVKAAIEATDSLFTDARKNRLKSTTTMRNIVNAERKVKAIPYVNDSIFEDVPGMNYAIFQQLQLDIGKAVGLYNSKNIIQNGDFSNGLSNWHATDGADVQERDGNPHVLVISQWDTNVSQEVCVQPERGYVLRVTARKEGSGKGYVTLSDCTEENTETVTFTSDEMVVTPRPPVRPQRPVEPGICDMTRYSESFGIVPEMSPMMNEQPENYGTGFCSCGCGKTSHMPSTTYQAQAYEAQPSMTNMSSRPSSGYITKTIEIFPETNRLRIEIGETEGTFLVESVELTCMEDE
ncbi:insecticidal delta-endotoxin Cry8Ea1 family protein (plasmid) [Bacillus toyonensis]